MAVSHRQWLATQVISDQQTVSYRTLARALKVHVNAAKRMLYDFHAHENAKKQGSIHATYLLAGTKKVKKELQLMNGKNGTNGTLQEDEPVPSSPPPFPSSMLQSSQQNGDSQDEETTSIRTITLVREESLEAVRSSYETITSMHIYSLSAYRLQDLQTLSDTGRHLYNTYFVKEDPLDHNKTYGVILNKDVRRRKGRRPPPTVESKPAIKPEPTSKTASNPLLKPSATPELSLKKEESSRPSSAGSANPTSTTTNKQPSLKRNASDIFKSFAKAKNAPSKSKPTPNLTRTGTDSSLDKPSHASKKFDSDSSEDENSESSALFHDSKSHIPTKNRSSITTSGKAEREAKLRKMMDDSDSDKDAEMEDAEIIDPEQAGLGKGDQPNNKDGKSQDAAIKQGTGTEEDEGGMDWSDSDAERQQQQQQQQPKKKEEEEEQAAQEATTAPPPKRRRGRRRVMKKKTMKDEEGYLVTREEAVWESFSEDEPVLSKTQTQTQTKSQSQSQISSQGKAAAAADKKAGAKGGAKGKGKGDIMSFFGKK